MITKTPIQIPDGYSPQEWAEQTPGVYMNLIAMAGKNPVDNKYHFAPIQYSDVNMEGEKVKYPDGREATAETKYGKVEIGATDNAVVKMHHEVMDASGVWGTDKSKLVNWMGFSDYMNTFFAVVAGRPVRVSDFDVLDSTAIDEDSNTQKISYFSPKFYGFQVGATYTPGARYARAFVGGSGAMNSTVVANNREFTRSYAVSAAYDGKMGPVTLGADFAYGNS